MLKVKRSVREMGSRSSLALASCRIILTETIRDFKVSYLVNPIVWTLDCKCILIMIPYGSMNTFDFVKNLLTHVVKVYYLIKECQEGSGYMSYGSQHPV